MPTSKTVKLSGLEGLARESARDMFTITIDNSNGVIEGNLAGSPVSGNCWLLNVTFQAVKGAFEK